MNCIHISTFQSFFVKTLAYPSRPHDYSKAMDLTSTYTHGHNKPHSWFSEKHFNSFDSHPIGIKKQMISHFKALVKLFRNHESKWKKLHPQCDKTNFDQKVPLLVWASFCTMWIELFKFSLLLSYRIVLGFLKRYVTPS